MRAFFLPIFIIFNLSSSCSDTEFTSNTATVLQDGYRDNNDVNVNDRVPDPANSNLGIDGDMENENIGAENKSKKKPVKNPKPIGGETEETPPNNDDLGSEPIGGEDKSKKKPVKNPKPIGGETEETPPNNDDLGSEPIGGEDKSKKKPAKKPKPIGGETDETPPVYGGTPIAEKDKSLDLYFTIDVSDSLGNTDPSCERLNAILGFKEGLVDFLGENGNVRAHFVKFSHKASYFGTEENFLSISNTNFKEKYKDDICNIDGGTNTSAGLQETIDQYNITTPNDLSSAIILTDGSPTLGKDSLPQTTKELQRLFGERIYGVLLYNSTALNSVPTYSKNKLAEITGDPERVKSVTKAAEITDALKWFLK